jgi:hypothetical protein
MGLSVSTGDPCHVRGLTVDDQSIICVRFEELLRHQTSLPDPRQRGTHHIFIIP